MTDDARTLLVFVSSSRSGPSRRMESLLAHLARKERATGLGHGLETPDAPRDGGPFRPEHLPLGWGVASAQ